MALDKHFMEEKNVEAKPKVEWNGKDFRGEQCNLQAITFMTENPKVYAWLHKRPKGIIQGYSSDFRQFCAWSGLTPEDFLDLNKKDARDKVWAFIDSFVMEHPVKAQFVKIMLKSFYLYHNEERLEFIPGKHDIHMVTKRLKYIMDKPTCWKIIRKAKNLRDETILTFAFESGLRRNAMAHMTFGHYKNFIWFTITKDGDVIPSKKYEGNIAIFKVMATPYPEHTHDNKLRGKGINWYYGCLHKEATKILKEYVKQYHQTSKDDSPFWTPLNKNKNEKLSEGMFLFMLKSCVKRASLPVDKINFHALRRGFRKIVRNTAKITDAEFKEAIMGHKLKGSQEAYFEKDPLEFAREYAKCDFSPPALEKDKLLTEKEKEIETLRRQLSNYEEAIEKAEATTKIEIEPLRPPATRDQIQNAFKDFNEALEEQSTPQPIETKPRPLPKQAKSSETATSKVSEEPKQPGRYSAFAALKEKPNQYVTCQADRKAYKLLELPCMVNTMLNCPNKLCEKEVMKLLT